MAVTIKLSDQLIGEAKRYGGVYHRSAPKQIEHWSSIGKIAEENPDLPYSFVKDLLLGMQEAEDGRVTPYQFG